MKKREKKVRSQEEIEQRKKLFRKIKIIAIVGFLVAFLVCVGLLIYCGIMTSYTAYTDGGTYAPIPAAYQKKNKQGGTIVRLEYETNTYYDVPATESHNMTNGSFEQYMDRENKTLTKEIYVYLPYGYNENGTDRYNILYHIHGTWCDGTTLIKGEGKNSETKNLLDNMITAGEIEPMIVVFPTWYNGLDLDDDDPDYLISHFTTEFRNDIIPLVETKYRTFASISPDMTSDEVNGALKASREHRAVSGYSRGGSLTWNIFACMMDTFKWYIPISGDYLLDFSNATDEVCTEKVEALKGKLQSEGYGSDDFFVFSCVGALDFAYHGVNVQFNAMLRDHDYFLYSNTPEDGNFYLCVAPKVWHTDTMSPRYLYNALPALFR